MASMIVSTLLLWLALSSVNQIVQSSHNGTEHQDGLLRIDLVRVESRLTSSADHIFSCQFASIPSDGAAEDDVGCHVNRMNMLSYNKFSYIGEIRVGQPAKTFRMMLDSGSAQLWLLKKDCSNIDRTILATYDCRQSTSFKNDGRPLKINYVNGVAVSGQLARENFEFGDLLIREQTFIQIDEASSTAHLQYYHMDGILGLNLETITDYPDVKPPIYSIMREARRQSNGASKQMLSLSLNHGSTDAQKAGQLIIGGLDHTRYVGQITWTRLVHSRQWRFRVDSIELSFLDADKQPIINELTVCPYGCEVAADTGTNVIAGNPRDIQMINEKIGAFHVASGVYALPSCQGLDDQLPQLIVTISGRKFSLTPSQYTFQVEGICYSAFKELESKNYNWILGGIFLGHFYTIVDYDNQRFGLAESPFKSEGSLITH